MNENATFKNGNQFQFELKDLNGNALAGEQLNITYSDDENQSYTVVTDSKCVGSFNIDDESA